MKNSELLLMGGGALKGIHLATISYSETTDKFTTYTWNATLEPSTVEGVEVWFQCWNMTGKDAVGMFQVKPPSFTEQYFSYFAVDFIDHGVAFVCDIYNDGIISGSTPNGQWWISVPTGSAEETAVSNLFKANVGKTIRVKIEAVRV